MSLDDSVDVIKGVGPKKAALLKKLGIMRVRDLLYYIPRDYDSQGTSVKIGDLLEGETYNITGSVAKDPVLRRINSLTIVTFIIQDETGTVEAVFFNQPYIRNMYSKGDRVYVSGKTKRVGKALQYTNPTIVKEGSQHEGMMPVYSLTSGLSQKLMRIIIKTALSQCRGNIKDIFPNDFRAEYDLAEMNFALSNIHFPENPESLKDAKRRLLFEELLLFNIALFSHESEKKGGAFTMRSDPDFRIRFLERLDFIPTKAQLKVMNDIESDLRVSKPMNRLMQGDVGSGKTMPAFYAMYLCVKCGFQCVMMAPTEVLAKQHFENAQRVFTDADINIELITGSVATAQKKTIFENVVGGTTNIVIGTHAVLYERLQFARLGLIITDEQHRFGVSQRALLETKSIAPHILIMSATPIPRSLALILYGKTDISIIDEMPPGRIPVSTHCVPGSKREDMYGFIEKEINSGAQVFVICPIIEPSDSLDLRSSEEIYDSMRVRFENVALLHGKMKATEKNEVLNDFKNKKYKILVSTTVIEVGIDIPDANIMVIENAERFGLAQLHQLRGRVGRGDRLSYCFLMCDRKNERLKIMTKSNDGFKIAEEDLRLRGPGQFLGGRQSGLSDLYMANLIRDTKLLEQTRQIARSIYSKDKEFYAALEAYANSRFQIVFEKTSVN